MSSGTKRLNWWLWGTFVILFGGVTVASFLPVRPLIGIFPAWSITVLAAVGVTVAVAVVAVRGYDWPRSTGGGA